MGYQKCGTGGGIYVAPVCRFNINNIRGVTILRAGAPNIWAGIDAAEQKTNMADQPKWTAGTIAPLPDNLYLSPRSDEFDLAEAFDTVTKYGFSKVAVITDQAEVDITLTFAGISPTEYNQLNEWNDSPALFQFIDDAGFIGHKVVTDGVQYPFFASNGICTVSSYTKTTGGVGTAKLIIPANREWFASFDETGVDATAITQIQALLSNT